jgi:DNA-nicking Smr family endonuclease
VKPPVKIARGPPQPIEPNRRRRLDLGRERMAASLDLHGLSRAAAHQRLIAFVQSRWAAGARAILVITGKGSRGDGVLRREVPEWLAQPQLRDMVAGLSEAHPRRGGGGALYVALRRHSR